MARPKKTTNDVSTFLAGLAGGVYFHNEFCKTGDCLLISWGTLHKAAGLGADGRSKSGIAREFSHEERGHICNALDNYTIDTLLNEGGSQHAQMAGRRGKGPTSREKRERAPSSVTKFISELQRFEQAWVTAQKDQDFASILIDYCGDFRSRYPNRPAIDEIMTEFSIQKIGLRIYLTKRLGEDVRDAIDPQKKLLRDLGSVFEAAGGKLAIRTDQDRNTTKTLDEDQPRSPFHSFVESVCKLLPTDIAPTHLNPGAWAIAIWQAVKDRDKGC